MDVWAARSGDRIRVQTGPFRHGDLPGWERRAGQVDAALFELLVTTTDDAEMAQAHEDIWAALEGASDD